MYVSCAVRRTAARSGVLAALVLAVATCKGNAQPGPLKIAAASDMAVVLPKLQPGWLAAGHLTSEATYAASAKLAEQIAQGARFDIAILAGERNLNTVFTAARCDSTTRIEVGSGPLVVVARQGLALPTQISDLAAAHIKFVSIANPAHAPYGIAAMEALTHAGIAAALRGRIVEAESVRHALTQVDSGASDYAIVAQALVYERPAAAFWPVPRNTYAAPRVTAVACSAHADARKFLAYLQTSAASAELQRAGFE